MNPLRTFSIILPTYNRISLLEACVRGIAALDYPRSNFQVIIVNDGGVDVPPKLVSGWQKELDLVLLNQENRGPSAARNLAVCHARNEWLAFIDDDCIPRRGWLMQLAAALAAGPDAVIGGKTFNGLEHNIYSEASQYLLSFLMDYYHGGGIATAQPSFFPSNNLAMSRRTFEQVGGFDEQMLVSEERDLCRRLLAAGHCLRYVPEAEVEHYRPMNLKMFWGQHVFYGNGAYYYHANRESESVRGVHPEPLSFYSRMLLYPFKHSRQHAVRVMALIALSQTANAFGFFQESFRARRAHNSLSAQKSL